ncbi:hypothetical protein [Janthinobacterium sp. S3T4]|nr:hypothetical protein [Janthinobacterium sp. S3T4]MBB5609144.1 hypothetical protein [Janthinobacterium sp. S3T4]MBB5614317.1 hypothetical protein [Janthinobacterium sp. S3M3]
MSFLADALRQTLTQLGRQQPAPGFAHTSSHSMLPHLASRGHKSI